MRYMQLLKDSHRMNLQELVMELLKNKRGANTAYMLMKRKQILFRRKNNNNNFEFKWFYLYLLKYICQIFSQPTN